MEAVRPNVNTPFTPPPPLVHTLSSVMSLLQVLSTVHLLRNYLPDELIRQVFTLDAPQDAFKQ